MKKKLGLALGAGGARGLAHIGVLQAFIENGINPDCIAGCSAGAVVGACFSAGISPEHMLTVATELKSNDIMEPIPNFAGQGLFGTKRMCAKLRSVIGNKRICDLEIPFCCVATDLIKGEVMVFSGRYDTVKAVAASSCIPVFFEPVEIAGSAYIDGGILQRVPVKAVKTLEPDVIVAVDVLAKDNTRTEYKGLVSVFERAFELVDKEDFERQTNGNVPDVLIMPDLGSMSQYTLKGFDEAYYQGYAAGLANVKRVKALLEAED